MRGSSGHLARALRETHQAWPPTTRWPCPWSATKITDAADEQLLRDQVGDDLLASLSVSRHVRAAEQGHPGPISDLEPANRAVLDTLRATVDAAPRDWARFHRQAVHFHLRNATAWANDPTREDLAGQIDPEFTHGPSALSALAA